MSFIRVENLYKIFGPKATQALEEVRGGIDKDTLFQKTRHVLGLNKINLEVRQGEFFVIMGLSGSGKSTLLRVLNRLVEPTAGRVLVADTEVTNLPRKELLRFRQDTFGMVFQHFALLPHYSILRNVTFPLELKGVSRKEREEKGMIWLERVGLSGYEKHYPAQLSGGQKQRVGLARALCANPPVLLMDEAFSALDPLIRKEMQDELLRLQHELKKTIVFVTHDLDEAMRLGDRIAIMRDGEVVQVGTSEEILARPADDYVAAFLSGVNPAKIYKVEELVQEPVTVVLEREGLRAALRKMGQAGAVNAYVVNRSGFFQGMVRAEKLAEALKTEGEKSGLEGFLEPLPGLSPGQTLEEALPLFSETAVPLPVLDGQGRLLGVVTRGRLIAAMAGRYIPQ
ncbi:quaternary amine ABC transporter ATP-binding protein [Meiothermus taiwanensis]|jgi:glycine betaine/proline transport system ATP-binding protein|uniref:Glycine betaine/carnitine transport ATP-binding protein GbuA n=2 Tax=Meiothermus taiwanensis TaxID=172827 RepID=A0A399DXV8_9DEIN|nr:glycine betaine/L-proline ABC transporter ATP-binding protein [Meiothermus taiwanensis]AWR87988.1 glycine betaine/L-proline ABC transporter, ATPase subunit [Meiothermus taiwanensis WR-220]KIQ54978.1 ABC transporter ATPase [Meiothermus taiwanensis]KZK15112.1 glycine betaine/L-proline ABC transporter ATP-binding protein [Meiothermus taiwanensis]RIH76987.1 Glycine betaine/carnitine transport ATP-binding protein GbuA [Meiothermus taiwanensis]